MLTSEMKGSREAYAQIESEQSTRDCYSISRDTSEYYCSAEDERSIGDVFPSIDRSLLRFFFSIFDDLSPVHASLNIMYLEYCISKE